MNIMLVAFRTKFDGIVLVFLVVERLLKILLRLVNTSEHYHFLFAPLFLLLLIFFTR